MLSQQPGAGGVGVQPDNLHALVARFFAAHYREIPARDVQDLHEEREKGIVRGALNGWCGKPNQKGTVPHPADAGAPRSWNHADIDNGGLQTADNCKRPAAN
jgi:hypothetical protein